MRIRLFFLLAFSILSASVFSQQIRDSVVVNLSKKLTQRMSDSLRFTPVEFRKVEAVNYRLIKRKTAIMSESSELESVRKKIQRVENTRDSLYRTILAPDKYQRYIKLKHIL